MLGTQKYNKLNEMNKFADNLLKEEATNLAPGSVITSTTLQWLKTVTQAEITDIHQRVNIARNLVQVIPIDAVQYSWREEDAMNASIVPEGSEVPLSRLSQISHYAKMFKTGIAFGMTREARDDSSVDIWARHVRKAAEAMSRLEDELIMNCLSVSVPNGIDIVKGVGGIGKEVGNHIMPGGTKPLNPLTYDAIVDATTILDLEYVTGSTMMINPRQKAELIKMEEFIGINEQTYITLPDRFEKQMSNGFIGSIFNLDCVVSANAVPGEALIFDRSRYGVLFERMSIEADNFEDFWTDKTQYFKLIQRFSPACLDRSSCVKINQLNQG